ncbi:MAG: hypothetical protein ACI4TV_02995 [Paludibacteraceae bacterium]
MQKNAKYSERMGIPESEDVSAESKGVGAIWSETERVYILAGSDGGDDKQHRAKKG